MQVIGTGDETQGIIISHCEYLQDAFGSATSNFDITTMELNLGFVELMFHFKSTLGVSAVSSKGATGTIIFCTNQDPIARTCAGKEGMLNFHGSQSVVLLRIMIMVLNVPLTREPDQQLSLYVLVYLVIVILIVIIKVHTNGFQFEVSRAD